MRSRVGCLAVLAVLLSLACGGRDGGDGRVSLALNWKPEPQFGGFFEALRTGAFAARGLEVELTGGPGAPVVQMVASGQVAYGIAAADEVVIARDRGTDVVAVYASYQTNPQGLMAHPRPGQDSLEGVFARGGTLAVEPGLPYVKFFQQRYDLSKMRIVPSSYSIAPFLQDPSLVQQCFVTSEPIAVRRQGVEPQVFLIADSGFDPYATVVIASGERVRERRAEVLAFVAAVRDGWRGYLDDPAPANAEMARRNPEMDAETFRLAAEAQAPLIETAHTREHGLGAMTLERWTRLAGQLRELGLLDREPDPAACFAELGAP